MTGQDDIRKEFGEAVNMAPAELEKWLASDESKSVGVTSGGQKKSSSGGSESVGHDSGEKIVAILRKNKGDLDDDDFTHMRKVTGYVKRHLAQKPTQEDVEDSRWRYSLMNWGHDPLTRRAPMSCLPPLALRGDLDRRGQGRLPLRPAGRDSRPPRRGRNTSPSSPRFACPDAL